MNRLPVTQHLTFAALGALASAFTLLLALLPLVG